MLIINLYSQLEDVFVWVTENDHRLWRYSFCLIVHQSGSAAANTISQYSLAVFLFVYICARGLHKTTWDGKSRGILVLLFYYFIIISWHISGENTGATYKESRDTFVLVILEEWPWNNCSSWMKMVHESKQKLSCPFIRYTKLFQFNSVLCFCFRELLIQLSDHFVWYSLWCILTDVLIILSTPFICMSIM